MTRKERKEMRDVVNYLRNHYADHRCAYSALSAMYVGMRIPANVREWVFGAMDLFGNRPDSRPATLALLCSELGEVPND